MDLGSALRVLLRQWLVVLLGLGLTLGACAYLYQTAEPRYQATGRMLLLLPANARGDDAVGSPFLYLPNGLNVLARIVSGAPQSRESRQEMAARGLTSDFQIGVDPTTPIITVSTEGPDPENVIATRDWLIDRLNAELLLVQQEENAPIAQTAHTRVYAAEEVPQALGGDWTRSVLAAVAAGGLITLVAAFAVDRLRAIIKLRRRRHARHVNAAREARPADKSPPSDGAEDPDTETSSVS